MVCEDGVGADVDGEDGGEETEAIDNPGFTVGEVSLGKGVEAAEEGAADAPAKAVIDADFVVVDVGTARHGHRSPRSLTGLTTRPGIERKKMGKKVGVPDL